MTRHKKSYYVFGHIKKDTISFVTNPVILKLKFQKLFQKQKKIYLKKTKDTTTGCDGTKKSHVMYMAMYRIKDTISFMTNPVI